MQQAHKLRPHIAQSQTLHASQLQLQLQLLSRLSCLGVSSFEDEVISALVSSGNKPLLPGGDGGDAQWCTVGLGIRGHSSGCNCHSCVKTFAPSTTKKKLDYFVFVLVSVSVLSI
ncbi:hypothetical protein ACLKA6_016470 [Drosophila palustris]